MLLQILLFILPLPSQIAFATALAVAPTPVITAPGLLPRQTETQIQTTTSVPTGLFIATQLVTVTGVTDSHVTIPGKTITIAIPTCIQTIIPDENGYVPPGTCHALWRYYPTFGAAIAFAVMFGAITFTHIWQAATYKKKFCWVIIMAGFWETFAFLFRTISTKKQQNTGIYLISQVFILLAPIWVNAFDYMLLGRMIHFFIPSHSLFSIPASTFAFGFVTLDVVAFIVQLIGGSTAGPMAPPEEQMKAVHIYMGGIGLQQFFIFVFLLLAVKFQLEMRKLEKRGPWPGQVKTGWRPLLYTLYLTLGLISTRIIFRFVEFSSGHGADNPIPRNEAYFYALEAVPMLFALLAFNIIHPGRVLIGPDSELPGIFATIKGMWRKKRSGRELLDDDNKSEYSETAELPRYSA